jgi:hypothetical protein
MEREFTTPTSRIKLEFLMKNPAAEQRVIFVREEKALRTFLILYWGSATPPSVAGN